MSAVRRLLSRLRGDQGLTLAEMVVSISVGSVLLLAVTAIMVAQVRNVDGLDKRNVATTQAGNALDLVTKQLRTATPVPGKDPFITATGTEVGFYANLNSSSTAAPRAAFTPQEVWIWTRTVNGKRQLCNQVRAIPAGAATSNLVTAGNRTCRVLVADMAAQGGTPLFTFLSKSDPISSAGSAVSSLTLTAGGAVQSLTDIGAVQITLPVKADTARDDNVVTTTSRVTLFNQTGA